MQCSQGTPRARLLARLRATKLGPVEGTPLSFLRTLKLLPPGTGQSFFLIETLDAVCFLNAMSAGQKVNLLPNISKLSQSCD